MNIENGVVTWSASDLAVASACEFAFLRALDVRQGRIPAPDITEDAMLERTSELGAIHEQRLLSAYQDQFPDGVVVIPRPSRQAGVTRERAHEMTLEALRARTPVIAQAALESTAGGATFIGYADFIVWDGDAYRVEDTKLARSAKVMALLQLAAYAECLGSMGVPVAPTVSLVLGDGTRSAHDHADLTPILHLRRERMLTIIEERTREGAATHTPVAWGDDRYTICGQCQWCEAEAIASDDVLRVATLTRTQCTKLRALGIETIAQLAASEQAVPGIGRDTLDRLRHQARLQAQATRQDHTTPGSPPPVEVADASAFAMIPAPSEGDIFFDFEGDPLYTEGDSSTWNLDYLWGWVDANEQFSRRWAHDFAGERDALAAFLDMVAARRKQHPDMHIYHYAPYERSHLLAMAARWGIGEEAVDDLLRDGVLVDLYPIVRRAVRVGSPSYSIKKLEPLYMGAERREGVDNAADSITEYAEACAARDAGNAPEFERRLNDIEQYNAYDCVSTLRLRDWLIARGKEAGVVPTPAAREAEPGGDDVGAGDQADDPDAGPSPLEADLSARALTATSEADAAAYRVASAAVNYHRRERKTFWHDHFARLVDPKEDWADTRDVFDVVDAILVRDWHKEGRQRALRRHVRLTGVPAPGSSFGGGVDPFALYDDSPYSADAGPGERVAHPVAVQGSGDDWVDIVETEKHGETWDVMPMALAPGKPPNTDSIEAAIVAWGLRVAEEAQWPMDAASDLLRRRPPRLTSGTLASADNAGDANQDNIVTPIVDSLLRLDRSYLAVQGPPGTGKTYVGSRAIARLVLEHQWKVGVVAQSHKVIEHMLDAIIEAGVPEAQVGKELKPGTATVTFTAIAAGQHPGFCHAQPGGYVVGGTAWKVTNRGQIDAGQFDLLVVDEAGQFALADTIASAECAQRLLLLGDPQQLPAVTQGVHPAPVDTPALGWLSRGHDVLPPEFGYFLAQSRRMDDAVARPVSNLSYAGALTAHPTTRGRRLDGIAPGLVAVPVAHAGNATASVEEAAQVVRMVRELLGIPWTDPTSDRAQTPLTERDFIVVTPYNAQRMEVERALRHAGLAEVPVGTVDKFQGQEAVVAIVTLAASSAIDAPRGMEFLVNRNRLNVAISRAKWAARVVYSPGLLAHLPNSPERLVELGRFARLVAGGGDADGMRRNR